MPKHDEKTESEKVDKLCGLVVAYVQEWGLSNLLITLPADWQKFASAFNPGDLDRFAFTGEDKITICVYKDGIRQICAEFSCASFYADA